MRRENVIFALINTERYKEGLASIPHKEFEDLSIVYYEFHPEQALYRLIKNEDMENDNLTEEELYELGFENTRRIMVPKVVSMSDMIRELAEEMGLEIRQEANMHLSAYVITNEQRQRGAANILYGDIMENVSQKLSKSGFFPVRSVENGGLGSLGGLGGLFEGAKEGEKTLKDAKKLKTAVWGVWAIWAVCSKTQKRTRKR